MIGDDDSRKSSTKKADFRETLGAKPAVKIDKNKTDRQITKSIQDQGDDDEADALDADRLEAEERLEMRREARAATVGVEASADDARKHEIYYELCVVPDGVTMPTTLDAACEAMAEAKLAYLRSEFADDPGKLAGIEKYASMEKANMRRVCSSMDVALGIKHAFDHAPRGYGPYINDIIASCLTKLDSAR
jgi:hypothetical protein